MSNVFPDYSIELIAGEDLTLNVNFRLNGNEAVFSDGDTAEMLIHGDDERVIPARKTENNIATFYLPSELTQELLKDGDDESYYEYCIRVKWASNGQHIPIHRKSLTVKRC